MLHMQLSRNIRRPKMYAQSAYIRARAVLRSNILPLREVRILRHVVPVFV